MYRTPFMGNGNDCDCGLVIEIKLSYWGMISVYLVVAMHHGSSDFRTVPALKGFLSFGSRQGRTNQGDAPWIFPYVPFNTVLPGAMDLQGGAASFLSAPSVPR